MTSCSTSIKPYGFNGLKIVSEDGGCEADLCGRQFQVTPVLTTSELRCNDGITDSQAKLDNMTWSAEAGGISLDVYNIMMGMGSTKFNAADGTISTSVLAKENARMPYFSIYGKSVGRDGDDVHTRLFRAQIQTIDGTFQQDEYFIQQMSGIAISDDNGNIFELVHHQKEQEIWNLPWPEAMKPVAWYRPEKLCGCNGCQNGDMVHTWEDSITNDAQYALTQTVDGSKPTLVEDWCNGHCALLFDGVDDVMEVVTPYEGLTDAPYGFVISGAFRATTDLPTSIFGTDAAANMVGLNAQGQFTVDAGTELVTSEVADMCPFTVGVSVAADGTSTVNVNGSIYECQDIGVDLPNLLKIGGGTDGTFSEVYITEVMIFSGEICVEDLEQMVERQQDKFCCCDQGCTCEQPCTNCP